MTKTLEKEIRILMFKLYPFRINYSTDRLTYKADMYTILKKFKVSEEFLRYYIQAGAINGYNWIPVEYHQNLSEQFMIDFQDKFDWMNISIAQNLSESFMRRMKNKILWNYSAENQKMSPDFIIEFYGRINYYCLIKNRHKDMKVLPDTLIYELSRLIDKNVFRDTFLKSRKITLERLEEIEKKYMWNDRFDILDL